jgi:outer membrane receptor for ferrienterochelin and colicins
MRHAFSAAALACCALTTQAHDGPHAATPVAHVAPATSVAVGQAWDFTLPSLDGSRFVQASGITGPVLVNFWGRDCPPCVAELPRLQAFAQANPHWSVLLVSTDSPAIAREFVQRHGITLPVLRPGGNVAALMRSAGNRSGGLPFTVALRSARICETQTGAVEAADLQRMAQACS